jgi:glyoxylase-like metal-dependent hydrolase (beta-lactamase superfamily II)
MVHIEHFTFNAFQERTLAVWDNDGNCAFVDPGFSNSHEQERLVSLIAAKGLKPVCIMLTHAHFDHIYGAAALAKAYDIPIYMHAREVHTLEVTNPYLCKAFGLPEPAAFEWNPIQEARKEDSTNGRNEVHVGNLKFEVLETPGHTPGGVCFLERTEKVLISGDTLFAGSCGRTDLPGGDANVLRQSLEYLSELEKDYLVFPGHGESTRLSREKQTNPYLRGYL